LTPGLGSPARANSSNELLARWRRPAAIGDQGGPQAARLRRAARPLELLCDRAQVEDPQPLGSLDRAQQGRDVNDASQVKQGPRRGGARDPVDRRDVLWS
jgi:hypothetical protein